MAEDTVEIWQSDARARIGIRRFDAPNDPRGHTWLEMILADQRFSITTKEREMNEALIRVPRLNPFRNGAFRNIEVPGQPAPELPESDDRFSDDEIKQLYAGHWKTFEVAVAKITEPLVLRRFLAIAEEVDVPVKRARAVEARLKDVAKRDDLDPRVFQEGGPQDVSDAEAAGSRPEEKDYMSLAPGRGAAGAR